MTLLRESPYICSRCLPRVLFRRQSRRFQAIGHSYSTEPQRRFLATVKHSGETKSKNDGLHAQSAATIPRPASSPAKIREALRDWELQQLTSPPSDLRTPDSSESGGRLADSFKVEVEHDADAFDPHDLGAIGDDAGEAALRPAFEAGDLLEVKAAGTRSTMLAICLGASDNFYHFYTDRGTWFFGANLRTVFAVPGFVDPSELQELVDYLPEVDPLRDEPNLLRDIQPPRHVGGSLIWKMQAFRNESEQVQQEYARYLDDIRRILGPTEQYLTLEQIATALLPERLRRDGSFSPAALYAVHRAVARDDLCFLPVSWAYHTLTYLFRVTSRPDASALESVDVHVRRFVERRSGASDAHITTPLHSTLLGRFVAKARIAIDDSRSVRSWSPGGLLGPIPHTRQHVTPRLPEWSVEDRQIIQYLYHWAARGRLPPDSRQHCTGSDIIRALDRYGDAHNLGPNIAWTFLQEIGVLSPWEIAAAYHNCLPGVEPYPSARAAINGPSSAERRWVVPETDVFAGKRKDWAGVTAYCVDSLWAEDLDDAVSLEAGDTEGTYWVHAHIADPASAIQHDSDFAAELALRTETTYLPGYREPMFPPGEARARFSLAADRPCLTISTKVDLQGTVLDYCITPGTLRDVVFMDADTLTSVCGAWISTPPMTGVTSFLLGQPPPEQSRIATNNRSASTAEDLSDKDKETLRMLAQVMKARREQRVAKGATTFYWPRPEVDVFFNNVRAVERGPGSVHGIGEPDVRVSYADRGDFAPIIEEAMNLAGEVVARWCKERGVPVAYRSQPLAEKNRAKLMDFDRDVLRPRLAAGEPLARDEWTAMHILMGADVVSTTPGTYFSTGVEAYTKVTSPLRRYGDLLAHWQIEAALLEEARRGTSLVGNTDDSFLPFQKDKLDKDILPMLRLREQLGRSRDRRDGVREWLIRTLAWAWRFGDSDPRREQNSQLQKSFRFTVGARNKTGLLGKLDWFDLAARMNIVGLSYLQGEATKLGEVEIGDEFEVVLEDIDVFRKLIFVKAVRRL